jgi:hypothetical protein
MNCAARITLSDAKKRMVAGRQCFKCANNLNVTLKGLETYQCPLWQKDTTDNQGSFDESGFDLDHINELSTSFDNSLENFQALCKSCHSVKTKKFLMKKTNNAYHPIYGKFVLKQGDHYVYVTDSITLCKQSKMWSKNRPCDELRVDEIKNYIQENGYVDGVIYLANIEGEGLVCYDGNHRRTALSKLNKSYKIIINVLENPDPIELCEKFVSLNKCVPVTELFLNQTVENDRLKDTILQATKHFCELWKDHRKTSPNPNRPNFNRDMLQDLIHKIISDENRECNFRLDVIIKTVNTYNETIKNNISSVKCSEKMLSKCMKSGCFLFVKKL